jgi:hypothetical protein
MKVELMPFQMEMMRRDDEKLLIACCGVSSGKTFAASVYIAKQLVEQKRIIAGAQNFTALDRVLFNQVIQRLREWNIPYDYSRSAKEIKVGDTGIVYGATSENPDAILGLSECHCLILDEASYLDEMLYQWGCDRLRGRTVQTPKIRLFTSPDNMNQSHAWFINLCREHPEAIVNASALDNRYTSAAFKEDLLQRYPPGTPLYEQQILGHITDTDIATQIVRRADFIATKMQPNTNDCWMGCDFSGGVQCDADVVAIVDSTGVVEIVSDNELNTQQKVAAIKLMYDKYLPKSNYADNTGGFGKGAIDLAVEKNITLNGVNFQQKPFSAEYPNLRVEAFLELARDIKRGFWVPNDVKDELLVFQSFIDNKGRIALIDKALIKKALGHSPDKSDAIALANYARNHGGSNPDSGYTAKQAADVADKYLRMFQSGY